MKKAHVVQSGPRSPAVISLGLTKGGKRAGAAESVTIREEDTLRRLWQWLNTPQAPATLCGTPHSWRKTFNECLLACQVDSYDFRPYSLRRGGATLYFGRHGSLDRLLVQGRWASSKTARIYINEGLQPFSLNSNWLLMAQPKPTSGNFRNLSASRYKLLSFTQRVGQGDVEGTTETEAQKTRKEVKFFL